MATGGNATATLTKAIDEIRVASKAASASVMGPAVQIAIEDLVSQLSEGDELWNKINKAKKKADTAALRTLLFGKIVEPIGEEIGRATKVENEAIKTAVDMAKEVLLHKDEAGWSISKGAEAAQMKFQDDMAFIASKTVGICRWAAPE